jgi:hypothetical protein
MKMSRREVEATNWKIYDYELLSKRGALRASERKDL